MATTKSVPCVRPQLDLAGLTTSLADWQTLSCTERLALRHLPVDTEEEWVICREALRGFASQVRASPSQLTDAAVLRARPWNVAAPPPAVNERVLTLGLLEIRWGNLYDEARYAFKKLAEPRREPEKFRAALEELCPSSEGMPIEQVA